jgi:uncharacterized protein (TIGR03437 family)
MTMKRLLPEFTCAFLLLSGTAAAQFTITGVVNAGSRLPGTSTSSGIAQGALFVVSARGIGPADFLQASFPLPTTEGLGGVTIQATVGGVTVDAIMVYVAPNEVAAILPSRTPIGTGTVRVSSNGATATAPIKVVAAAFGIFTQRYGFLGPAVSFNVSPEDGSMAPNTFAESARPGQDVVINGTGLGAISGDETQSGVTDVPAAAIQVFVGVNAAAVVSAGRGDCCDGLDPAYRVPRGIAAWDVIRFTIPEGVAGCYIPVVVQIGTFVSNLSTISISPGGGACVPAVSTLPELSQQLAGKTGVSLGDLSLGRVTGINPTAAGATSTVRRDVGNAAFVRYNNVPASMFAPDYVYAENVCSIGGFPGPNGGAVGVNGIEAPIVPLMPVSLDVGPAITVSGPGGTRTITRQMAGMQVRYTAPDFGNSTPGNYLDPGHYTFTAPGGRDIGGFSASLDVPSTPFVWTNIPSVTTPIDRSKDLTITWTGGIPDTQVVMVGGNLANGATTAFLCAAPVSAGQFTIPSWVFLNLSPNPAPALPGSLAVQNRKVSTFTVPGLDIPTVAYSAGYTTSLRFQ